MNAHREPHDHRSSTEAPAARAHGSRGRRKHRGGAAAGGSAKLARWQRRGVYWGSGALTLSGLAALLLHHYGTVQSDFGPAPNPAEHPLLAVHGAVAMLFLLLLGSLLPAHILRGWQQRRNLASGVSVAAVQSVLIVSAYALYYASGDGLRAAVSLVHWVIGITVVIVLPWHVISGRRRAA